MFQNGYSGNYYNGYLGQYTGQTPNYNPYLDKTNYYNQNQINSNQQQPQIESNVVWIQVNGVDGAKDIIVSPNQTKWLMDINSQSFFVKSSDNLGVSSIKCYKFEEFDPNLKEKQDINISDTYVTKAEFDTLKSKIEQYENFIFNNNQNQAEIEQDNSKEINKKKK